MTAQRRDKSLVAWRLASIALAAELSGSPAVAQPTPPLRQIGAIVLPNVEGRIDHFNVDVRGLRLFIAALGNHSIEVVNLGTGKWLRNLSGAEKPQGIWYVQGLGKLFVADGKAGNVKVYRGGDLRLLATIALDLGPDAEAYDAKSKRLYVGYGGEDAGKTYGELGIIDAVSNNRVGDVRTSAHPGGILVARPGRTIYITVPKTHEISQIDANRGQIVATWKSSDGSPVCLAYDGTHDRLFVGTRNPAAIEIFDARSHRRIASLPSVGLMDGLYYDATHRRIYASGGEGFVAVYRQAGADNYVPMGRIATAPNGRTSLWVPSLDRYFVALPAAGGRAAEILVFRPIR